MEVLLSVKIFDVDFLSDLYVLRSPESKKSDFWKLVLRISIGIGIAYVCMRVCVCVYVCVCETAR